MLTREEMFINCMKPWLRILLVMLAFTHFSVAVAATFDILNQKTFGSWSSILFKNQNGDRLFCALQSTSDGVVFRVNQYRDTKDTFL